MIVHFPVEPLEPYWARFIKWTRTSKFDYQLQLKIAEGSNDYIALAKENTWNPNLLQMEKAFVWRQRLGSTPFEMNVNAWPRKYRLRHQAPKR